MFINSFGVVTVAVTVAALLLLSLSLSRLLSLPYLFVLHVRSLHVDYSSLARLDRGSMASLNLYLNEAAQLKVPLSLFFHHVSLTIYSTAAIVDCLN